MKGLRQFALTIVAALFIASTAVLSFAADPPSRVARLKYIDGQVSMQPGGVNDWVPATINRPLTTADRVWTDRESRAELRLGTAAMRMNSETSLTLSNLSDSTVQVELDQGTLNLHIDHMFNGEIYEVDTPNTAFTILKSGTYRFDVDSQGDTTLITVWKGRGLATGDGPALRVESHRQVQFSDGRSLAHQIYNAPRLDGFDEWCRVRDERESHVFSVRYVSPDVIGYEDLDDYGQWREVPYYGAVWVPTEVAYGWAPYRYGHWIWVEPWGWTWVDDAPWGFAPFHYGRWVVLGGSWAWVPGPVRLRPCYAPALVAWVGGPSFGISIGIGEGMGWFPLGYGDPYIPYYRASRNYFRTVNVTNTRITNITYVTNNYYSNNVYNNNVRINNIHYVNQRVPGAVTVVDKQTVINSEPVGSAAIPVRNRDWHDVRVVAGPAVPPSRQSVLGMREGERGVDPSDRIASRPVVMKLAPPPRPVPFEVKERELARNPGRPLDSAEEQRLRRTVPPEFDRGASQSPHYPGDPGGDLHAGRPYDPGRGAVADRRNDPNPRPDNTEVDRDGSFPHRNFPHPGNDDRGPNTGAQQSQSAAPVPRPGYGQRDSQPMPSQQSGGMNGMNGMDGRGDDMSASRRFPHPGNSDHGPNAGAHQSQSAAPVPRPGNGQRDSQPMPPQQSGGMNGRGDDMSSGRSFPHPGNSDHGPNAGAQQPQSAAPVPRPGDPQRNNPPMPPQGDRRAESIPPQQTRGMEAPRSAPPESHAPPRDSAPRGESHGGQAQQHEAAKSDSKADSHDSGGKK